MGKGALGLRKDGGRLSKKDGAKLLQQKIQVLLKWNSYTHAFCSLKNKEKVKLMLLKLFAKTAYPRTVGFLETRWNSTQEDLSFFLCLPWNLGLSIGYIRGYSQIHSGRHLMV